MTQSDGALDYALDALDKATAVRAAGAGAGTDRRGVPSSPAELPGLDFSFRAPSFLSGRSRWVLLCLLAGGGFLSLWLAYRMAVEAPAGHGAEWVLPPIMSLIVGAVAFALAYATVMGFGQVEIKTSVGAGAGTAAGASGSGGAPTPDASAITVATVAPAEGASGVAPASEVSATFSAPVSASTVSGTTFTLRKQGAGAPIPATVTVDPDGMTAVLHPGSALEPGATYEAHVAGTVQDTAGRALGRPRVWTFTTAPAPDA